MKINPREQEVTPSCSKIICFPPIESADVITAAARLKEKFENFKEKKLIREVVYEIPGGILPPGNEGWLKDISTRSKGADDELYMKHEELRKHLPRGTTELNITKNSVNNSFDYVIHANRKFSGETDDSDSSSSASDFCLEYNFSTTQIIAMEKINGEAAHFSGRYIDGEFYLIAGSKNVHLIFQNEEHIDLYFGERFSIAIVIARTLLKIWNNLSYENRLLLQNFLHDSKTTVVCEIMLASRQHVVYFGENASNRLIILCLAPPPNEFQKSLTALPTEEVFEIFNALGFEVPNYRILEMDDLDAHHNEIRQSRGTEGVVYYFENDEGHTISIVKFKSSWYFHLRALRQQATYRYAGSKKNKTNKSFDESKVRSRKRMDELQEWLYTSTEDLNDWKTLSDHWFDWLEQEVPRGTFPNNMLRDNFPVIWKSFQSSKN